MVSGTSEPGLAEPGLAEPGFAPFSLEPTPPGGGPIACIPQLRWGERLVYITAAGVPYVLHAPPNRVVTAEEGFGTPPMEYVVDRAPFQHGDTVRDFHLAPRPIQLVVLHNFRSRTEYWAGRAVLLSTVQPDALLRPGSLLKYQAGGSKRQLDVYLESGPGFVPPQGGWREWSFSEAMRFIAHDPVWYDPRRQETVFDATGTTAFERDVVYGGTWPEQPSFVVTGPVDGLELHNHTNGALLSLPAYSLAAGRSLTVQLRGDKSIRLDDNTNLMPYLSVTSDLTGWQLAPGVTNTIHVHGTSTTGATSVLMHWYNRYFGI
jgi:hypothetical protein